MGSVENVVLQQVAEAAASLGTSVLSVKVRLIGSGMDVKRSSSGSARPVKSTKPTSSKPVATEPTNRILRRAEDHFNAVFKWVRVPDGTFAAKTAMRKWHHACEAHQLLVQRQEDQTPALVQFIARFEKARATIEQVLKQRFEVEQKARAKARAARADELRSLFTDNERLRHEASSKLLGTEKSGHL